MKNKGKHIKKSSILLKKMKLLNVQQILEYIKSKKSKRAKKIPYETKMKYIKKTVAITVCCVLLINSVSYAFAFFTAVPKTVKVDASLNAAPTIVEVATQAQLRKATTTSFFNSLANTSTTSERVVVKLTDNITLTQNLIVTRDCHIDLNGKTLSIGKNSLTIKHSFYGSFVITSSVPSGQIAATTGTSDNFLINTPNAVVIVDETKITLTNIRKKIVSVDSTLVINGAMNAVVEALRNDGEEKNLFENINDINNIKLQENPYCKLHTDATTHSCCYFKDDIFLPTNYYLYDAKIEYTSSDETALSPLGNVFFTADTSKLVNLTAKVTYNGVTTSKDFEVHLINPTDKSSLNKAAVAVLTQHLAMYKEANGIFSVGTQIMLPNKNSYFDTTLSYKTYANETDTTLISSSETSNANFSNTTLGVILFSPTTDTKWLEIISTKDNDPLTSHSQRIQVVSKGSSDINDNFTAVDAIVRSLFGGREIQIANLPSDPLKY
ncbi:MAG: hypothetical protein RR036_04715, partial [Oscillospiraceae bacterium]